MKPISYAKRVAGKLIHRLSPTLDHELRRRFSKTCWDNWPQRTKTVLACPENALIPRVPQAGQIDGEFQIMHNGIKVLVGSYYGEGPIELLRQNRGVHEPQEEYIFQEVLKYIPERGVILELGAYWAFYSMWFCREVKNAQAFLVEPESGNLVFGKRNFEANRLSGKFTRALVGAAPSQNTSEVEVISVDHLMAEQKLEAIHLLHSDIQGHELEMLEGSKEALRKKRISYLFISTHSETLHSDCEKFLASFGYLSLASVSPKESYSMDGILVARNADFSEPGPFTISKRVVR
jgi:hypothetical protein